MTFPPRHKFFLFMLAVLVGTKARASIVMIDAPPVDCSVHITGPALATYYNFAWETVLKKTAEDRIKASIFASKGATADDLGYTEVTPVKEVPGVFLSLSFEQWKMNRIFSRISLYSEGLVDVPAGTIAGHFDPVTRPNESVAIRVSHALVKGWNLPGRRMQEFFQKTLALCAEGKTEYCLDAYEQEFYDSIYKPHLEKLDNFYFIAYSVWSVGPNVVVAGHEILHAQFTLNEAYRAIVYDFWENKVTPEDKTKILAALAATGYSLDPTQPETERILRDEFQAYMLQPLPETKCLAAFVPFYRKRLIQALARRGVVPFGLE